MPATLSPFLLTDVTLTLKKVGAAEPAAQVICQLGKAQITPAANQGTTQEYATFCDDFSSSTSAATTFTLDLGGFQAYADVTDLSRLLWIDAGEKYEFVLAPQAGPISDSSPGFSGVVTFVEAPVGGTAKTYATYEVSLPCDGKPELLTAPPVAADAAASEPAKAKASA
jgi:hypothetical protein